MAKMDWLKTKIWKCLTCSSEFIPKSARQKYCDPTCIPKYDQRKTVLIRYKLDPESFKLLLKIQDNKCAICKIDFSESKRPNVDHDHECCPSRYKTCGKCVRGALCQRCNLLCGFIEKDLTLVETALEYLTKKW